MILARVSGFPDMKEHPIWETKALFSLCTIQKEIEDFHGIPFLVVVQVDRQKVLVGVQPFFDHISGHHDIHQFLE